MAISVIKCGQNFRLPPPKKKKRRKNFCWGTPSVQIHSRSASGSDGVSEITTGKNMWSIICDVYGKLKIPHCSIALDPTWFEEKEEIQRRKGHRAAGSGAWPEHSLSLESKQGAGPWSHLERGNSAQGDKEKLTERRKSGLFWILWGKIISH